MILTVGMDDLKKHVNFVRNGLGSSKSDLPVMLMRFDVVGDKVTVFASNKEMFCRTEFKVIRPAEEEGTSGSFTIMGSKVERLTSSVEAEAVTFVVDDENLEVRAGLLTVNFELLDGAVLKTAEVAVGEHLAMEGLTVQKAVLEEAMSCAKSCVVTTSIRPDITHMEVRNQRALSSDGRKVAIYKSQQFPEKLKLKVPGTVLGAAISAVKNTDGEHIQVMEGKSYYYFKGGTIKNQYTFGVRKVERSFPNIEVQLEKAGKLEDEVSVDKKTLESILKGVALGLASEEVGVEVTLSGEKKESYLEVSARNSIGRRSFERASVGRKATVPMEFPVSFKHLLDTLSVFKGDSVVELGVATSRNVLLVFDRTDTREVVTVIPFRTVKQVAEEAKEKEALDEARKKDKDKEELQVAEDLSGEAVEA